MARENIIGENIKKYRTKEGLSQEDFAKKAGEEKHVHEGIYCALTGPTYETSADCQFLRKIGASAVGMSTVPEIIVASSLGIETLGLSLICNVIAKDGTNATSHEEVMAAINNPKTKERIFKILREFFNFILKQPFN